MTAKAAVVGWPIQHSLSPVLHGHWLKEYGIDGSYEKIAIEPGTFSQRIAELRANGYRGVNVTVPFKEEAFALAQKKQEAAAICGAANLLAFGEQVSGNNTDAFGLADSVEEVLGKGWLRWKNVVMLGAGGAARGVAYGLQHYGASEITILNRSKDRADQLAADLGAHLPDAIFRTGTLDDWNSVAADSDLVVNTTSAGMKDTPPLNIDLSALPEPAAICDIVYNPLMTPLLKEARARGYQTIDGLGMLMHQAAPSFEAFFGVKPKVTRDLRAALMEALQSRG
jgi:shikimate dehydrogenase